jgi:DNA-binding NtrC family response regulator
MKSKLDRIFSIIIVEDEENLANLLLRVLKSEGYDVTSVGSITDAWQLLKKQHFDLLITDIKLPDGDGITFLEKIKSQGVDIEVIVMTAFATVETAISALKMGARDYIRKPFDLEEVISAVRKVVLQMEADSPVSYSESHLLVTNSDKMRGLLKLLHKVAQSNANIYIHGETGAGKELVAHAIHELSDRKDKPFIKVNCSALPETLLESELFGYEKGAFTGAFNRKLGRFELANGGTIFLDEIGDISPLIQLKLLRIIQQKELERLGGTQTISLDVRIISATNKSLEQLVKEGSFREDLYYRLNVIPLDVPPLRERREDMRDLIESFIEHSSKTYQTKRKAISEEAYKAMLAYDWPGNVRELENIVERLLLMSEGAQIELNDLPEHLLSKEPFFYEEQIDAAEANMIKSALIASEGNVTKAAEQLGISRRSLHRKINKYHLK